MWKYQCKKHLVVLLVSFAAGAVLFGFMGYQREYIVSLMQQSIPAEMAGELVKADYMYYLIGGLTISGLANGVMLLSYAMQRFNVPFILIICLLYTSKKEIRHATAKGEPAAFSFGDTVRISNKKRNANLLSIPFSFYLSSFFFSFSFKSSYVSHFRIRMTASSIC